MSKERTALSQVAWLSPVQPTRSELPSVSTEK